MFKTRNLALTVAVVLVVGSFTNSRPAGAVMTGESSPSSAAIPTPGGYDGKTLYVGFAFGQGPVAALFPELQGLGTVTAAHQDYIDATVAEISNVDPTFFDRFASEIQSGDRVRIRAALAAADEVGAVAASRIGVNEPSARMVADLELAFFVAVIVVVFVIAFIGPITAPSREARVTPLDRDIAADRIARVLRVDA